MTQISFAQLRAKIRAEYKQEVRDAKLQAYKKMNKKLSAIEKAMKILGEDVDWSGGTKKPNGVRAEVFGNLEVLKKVLADIKPGANFTSHDLFHAMKQMNPATKYRTANATISKFYRSDEGKKLFELTDKDGKSHVFVKKADQ